MNRSRRSILRLSGAALGAGGAGCSAIRAAEPEPPEIESRGIEEERSRCVADGTGPRTANVAYEPRAHRLTIDGTTATARPCTDLFLTSHTGVGRKEFDDDSIHLSVDVRSWGDCAPCPAAVEYAATVEFDRDPSAVYVYHVEEVDGEWKRLGPLATESVA